MQYQSIEPIYQHVETGKKYTLKEYLVENPYYSEMVQNNGTVWIDGVVKLREVSTPP